MSELISTDSRKSTEVTCLDLRDMGSDLDQIDARHVGIPGFDQGRFSSATAELIGAGGLNGENAEGLARKGIGRIYIFDGDTVERSNLNRQHFKCTDVGYNKADSLARNSTRDGFMGTHIQGFPMFIQEAHENGIDPEVDVIVCGVDNDPTRAYVCRYGIERSIPVVFSAVSSDGNQGYVFIQQPGSACFGCALPAAASNERTPCPGVPAIKDILKIVSGLTLYAVDTLLMNRKRNWNYREIQLAGFMPDQKRMIERRSDCALCSSAQVCDDETIRITK